MARIAGRRAALLVAATLAGAVALLWPRSSVTPPGGSRAALVAAVGGGLPFDARLSGGFLPADRPVMRAPAAPAGAALDLSPDARMAIAELEKGAAGDSTPAALADLGVAYLVSGDVDRSIAALSEASSQGNAAAAWSDLSAAYLAKAERVPARRIEYLSRALDASARSLKVAPSNEARYNQALARDRLMPYVGDTAPWAEYLEVEPDPKWRDAAARRAGDQRPIDDVRDRWEVRQQELRSSLARLDRAFVDETVRLYPEASLEFLDQQTLLAWGQAVLDRDDARARSALAEAHLIADAFHAVTGDPMPREELVCLRAASAHLAQAHVAYAEGALQESVSDRAGAKRSLARAQSGFARARCPYQAWADARLATILFQERSLEDADARLAVVERDARARQYTTLLARTLWVRGLVSITQWRLTDALSALRSATALYEAGHLSESAINLYHHQADALRTLGEQQESWEYIGRTLEGLSRVRKPIRRYVFLYNAALFASGQNLMDAALLFQDACVREAEKAGAEVVIEARIQRALVHLERGDQPAATTDLDAATSQLAPIAAGPFKTYMAAEINIVRAQLTGRRDAASTGAGLRSAIAFFERVEPARVPRLYLLLARTYPAHESSGAVEEALAAGIGSLESLQTRLGEEAFKISYFDDAWELFQDMVTLQLAVRKDPVKAFEYAERSRARSLLASAQGSAAARPRLLSEVRVLIPTSMTLVYYVTLPNRLLIWTVSRSGATLVERPIEARTLSALVQQHRESISSHRENSGSNDRLYAALLQPVVDLVPAGETLVFAPDGALQQLPMATLRNPATRRYLIEDHTLLVTPSASFFVAAPSRGSSQPASTIGSALLVGNPAGAAAALPGAEAEVAAAAKFYARSEALTGIDATKDRFVQLAPQHDVVHFGGHALANAEYPLLSRLVFATAGGTDQPSLFAHEISRMPFSRTRLVVLAACSTASGAVSRGEGVVSVARPFLAAGVPLVVASQWDVDDRATAHLSLKFHEALREAQDPVKALRAAQLSMLRSADAQDASPASWGAFVAMGTTAR